MYTYIICISLDEDIDVYIAFVPVFFFCLVYRFYLKKKPIRPN